MAIEALRKPIREVQKRFHLDPIVTPSPYDAFSLLNSYWSNRLSSDFDMTLEKPKNVISIAPDTNECRIKGILEVQSHALRLLGLEALIGENKPKEMHPIANRNIASTSLIGYIQADRKVHYVRALGHSSVVVFLKQYKNERRKYTEKNLDYKEMNLFTADESQNYGRLKALEGLLVDLGQRNILTEIDQAVSSKSSKIDWAKMRSTGRGELM